MATIRMSTTELYELPVAFDLETAGRAFGLGRTKSHELARADDFPCPVLRLGKVYRVTKADLFRALGIEFDGTPAEATAVHDGSPETAEAEAPAA
jgi:hypothetical protein